MMGPKQTERGPITKSDGTKMGPKRGLNRVIFSTLLFVSQKQSAPYGALCGEIFGYCQSRITLPEAPLRMMSKPFWKSSTLKW